MAIRRSPGCNCCGSTVEPCDCCVDRELKPLPVKTGTSFTDTAWDDDWVGVDNKASNTLPANTHAYIDVDMSCQTRFSVDVEIIDFGIDEGAKVWVNGMMAECYRTDTDDGKSLVVSVSAGLSYGIGAWTGAYFAGPRYAGLIFSSRQDQGGLQRFSVGLADTVTERIDAGEIFFATQPARAEWAGSQSPLGPQTIRINIETSSSSIQVGQVRVRHGWSGCAISSVSDTEGDNTTVCYASRGMSIVNSGAQNLTTTETSTGVTNGASGGGTCAVADPNPCATWVNTLGTDYTPLNGTFYYELERETNFWESNQVPYPSSVYESANWADVNDWLDSVYAWSWSGSEKPISFWEYSQAEPEVEVTSGSNIWDDTWANLTYGADVCGLLQITNNPLFPVYDDCPAFAENYNAPVAVTTRRQPYNLFDCDAVNICNGLEYVYPAFRLSSCSDTQPRGRWGIVFSLDQPDGALADFVVPAINLSVDQSNGGSHCYPGDWNYTVVRGGFTMTRVKTNAVELIANADIGAKPDIGILKDGTITDFTVTETAVGTPANQSGNSYVPQDLTFNGTGFPAGCDPDTVYRFGTPSYGESTWECLDAKSSPWVRVDTDDGESWDIAISSNFGSFDIRVRRYSDCELVYRNEPDSSLPTDKCNTVPISFSTGLFDVSFTWRVA